MAALQSLADTNVEIGKAKGALATLKKDEIDYLKERETRASSLVDKVLEASKEVIQKAWNNYARLKELMQMSRGFATFLVEASDKFHTLYETFKENVAEWEKKIKKQEADISEVKKALVEQEKDIEKEKKGIEKAKKQIEIDKLRIKDDTERLARAVERLKSNRV